MTCKLKLQIYGMKRVTLVNAAGAVLKIDEPWFFSMPCDGGNRLLDAIEAKQSTIDFTEAEWNELVDFRAALSKEIRRIQDVGKDTDARESFYRKRKERKALAVRTERDLVIQ